VFRITSAYPRATTRPRTRLGALRGWLLPLLEWPLWALLALLIAGIVAVAQQPFTYAINIGYDEGWHSDQPFVSGWNTPEPYKAPPDQLSYRWTGDDSTLRLPSLGAQPLLATIHQLAAAAHPAVDTGALYLSSAGISVGQPLNQDRRLHVLLPPSAVRAGTIRFSAPTFTPPDDPRILGAPIADIVLATIQPDVRVPSAALFWPVLLLPLAWVTARRWSVSRGAAALAGLGLCALLLAAQWADPFRFALAGGPLLSGAFWGAIVAAIVLWATTRYAPRLGVQPSPALVKSIALLVFWMMLLRYGGRLYPDSMVGDLGFHVNRQNDVIRGLIFIVSRHRGIDFPYPSATYLLLAPFRLLPIAPETLVEFTDALFGVLGLLPVAYIALRGLRNERAALLATTTYALLAPAMMALWWSFQAHILAQEAIVLLIALLIGLWERLGTARGVALITLGLCLIFFGHFGLFLNVSLLLALLLPLLWWRYRSTPQVRSVYGLALAFAIAEALALGLFYSAYLGLILTKLAEFGQGGMGAVQGGRAEISARALLVSLWRDGIVGHYALVGVPLALLGGWWLWLRQRGSLLVWLFCGTLAVATIQALVPFITASTITTRWLSFCAWVIALGTAVVLNWLWQRGRWGRGLVLITLLWIGGNTLWLWVKALGYRIRPPEPF
jgi:hypothetical protein